QRPDPSRALGDHLRVEQDLTVPAGTVIDGNLVVAGRCWLGKGERVNGSLKVHRELTMEPGVVVTGAIVCRLGIKVGEGSWIMGPVISEEHLEIGTKTTIGKREQPTTVSARSITIAAGSVVCGQMMGEE